METNCINDIQPNTSQSLSEISLASLRQLKSPLGAFFQVSLPESREPLFCQNVVRILPGKRLVAFGTWGDKTVVIKLFYARGKSAQHAERDYEGIKILTDGAVLAPAVYYHGPALNKRIRVIVFEKIAGLNLDDIWQGKQNIKSLHRLLKAMTIELATQHVLGILQHDLHFKNFIIQKNRIYTIDGGAVEVFDKPLSKIISIDNLALFFAQLGVGKIALKQSLFQLYAQSRGWQRKEKDLKRLELSEKNWQKSRWENYSEKIMRTCTAFMRLSSSRSAIMYDRSYETSELLSCLKNPDAKMTTAQILKNGRSATVAKIKIDQHEMVLKRYNIKGIFHWLRRCLRPTRAACGWKLGQLLRISDIPTAKPIAYIEKTFLGLRNKSYFLMEYVEGVTAGEFFETISVSDPVAIDVAQQIVEIFFDLALLKITHGDLKKTNILIRDNNPVLIDLDGMTLHKSNYAFKLAFKAEIKRFMENWHSFPSVYKLFDGLIKQKILNE
ncbi:MAG: lipopolysaccharide kinase InaA family protein [Gammaproteobacteria bacterium]|nr:lipopolysaccharide kinase InaA family protein [Gammaproteobacteria bacterium]